MAIANPCFVLAGLIRTFLLEDGDGERGTADESLSLFIRHWNSVGWIKRGCWKMGWCLLGDMYATDSYTRIRIADF